MPPKKRGCKKQNHDDEAGPSSGRHRKPEVPPIVIDVEDEWWKLSEPDSNIFDPEIEYADRPDHFTIALHHNGVFHDGEYIVGKLDYFDYVSVMQFNLFEMSSMLLRLWYDRKIVCEFYYCNPCFNDAFTGTEVGHPLLPLMEDEHVRKFMKFATQKKRLIHVYALGITRAEAEARYRHD